MRPTSLVLPTKPDKTKYKDSSGNIEEDEFAMARFEWQENYKSMMKRKEKYKENESNAWALIYDQCSPELKNKLEGATGYEACKNTNNVVALLTMIRGYCCQFDTLNNEFMSIVGAMKNLMYFFQKPNQSNSDYHEDFMAMVEVIEDYGGAGSLSHFPKMIQKELDSNSSVSDPSNPTTAEMNDAKKVVRDKYLAALMLNGANRDKYGELKRSMAENYVTGTSDYPESSEMVLRILNAYQPPPGWNRRMKAEGGDDQGAMFAQTEGGDWKKNIACHTCGKKGHLARECRSKGKTDNKGSEQVHANMGQDGGNDVDEGENLFVQQRKGVVDPNYILLDNQSTVNQIANANLLKNIRKADKPIIVHCNAGSTKTDLVGDLGGMTVHHNPNSIANVLSLKSVAAKHRVTYDSEDRGGVFKVHTPNGVVEFMPTPRGLHYIDVGRSGESVHHMLVTNTGMGDEKEEEDGGNDTDANSEDQEEKDEFVMVNTVRKNFEGFTMHKIKKAQEAQRLQGMIGIPTDKEFVGMVREKLIANCPVNVKDIQNANHIFGPDRANLRGKQTRTSPERVRVDYVNVPQSFMDIYKYVTIVADVMFVNGLPFLVTSSRGISLITIEYLPSRTAK